MWCYEMLTSISVLCLVTGSVLTSISVLCLVTGSAIATLMRLGSYGSIQVQWMSGFQSNDLIRDFAIGSITPSSGTASMAHGQDTIQLTLQVSCKLLLLLSDNTAPAVWWQLGNLFMHDCFYHCMQKYWSSSVLNWHARLEVEDRSYVGSGQLTSLDILDMDTNGWTVCY